MKNILIVAITILFMPVTYSQYLEDIWVEDRVYEEIPVIKKDICSIGFAAGVLLPEGDIDFGDVFVGDAAIFDDEEDFQEGYYFQFSFQYNLDHYWFPGAFFTLKLNYAQNDVDVDLEVFVNDVLVFVNNNDFLSVTSFGISPQFGIQLFPFFSYLFGMETPYSWEIYLFAGPKFTYNIYDDADVDLEDLDALNITWEAGGGIELYLSDTWSLDFQAFMYQNYTELTAEEGGVELFDADVVLYQLTALIGIKYYF